MLERIVERVLVSLRDLVELLVVWVVRGFLVLLGSLVLVVFCVLLALLLSPAVRTLFAIDALVRTPRWLGKKFPYQ